MGKGDKKTRRGKIRNGSYGVRRPKKTESSGETPKKGKKKKA
ncbi:MAG: 30S ribosomal protein THX [Marinoscillum sp.]